MKQKFRLSALCLALNVAACGADSLERQFASPPDSARPGVLWQWMGGMVSREGITKDLEALAGQGIGKVMVMQMPDQCPWPRQWQFRDYPGKVRVLSDEWFATVNFAIGECDRLGMDFGMFACPGWGHLGGPWVAPEMGAKKLGTSVLKITGPATVDQQLPDFPVSRPAGTGNDIPNWNKSHAQLPKVNPLTFENVAVLAVPDSGQPVPLSQVIDLSENVDSKGRISWKAPEGKWIIVRHGLISDNSINHPSPPEAMGLEVDRFDPAAIRQGIDGMIGRIKREANAKGYRSFTAFETDSYEVGYQDFGRDFQDVFRKRRGYDCLPWLPAWHHQQTGVVLGSAQESQRFREDMSRTISELWAERFAGTLRKIADDYGMQWLNEPYFSLSVDWTSFGGRASSPGAEFWVGDPPSWRGGCGGNAAEIADLYGSRVAWAEAFTAESHHSAWRNDPWILKRCGDTGFADGINLLYMHGFVHNPFPDDYQPGLTMGYWGTQLGRHVTWWNSSRSWHTYLARCQFMLQQGRLGYDVLSYPLQSEEVPNPYPGPFRRSRLPDELLGKLTVRDGKLILPHGATYSTLYLTGDPIRPEALAVIKQLIEEGAWVIGNPPPRRAVGLQGYPACDAEISGLIDEMWGTEPNSVDRQLGKGRLVAATSLEAGMEKLAIKPDFTLVPVGHPAKILSTYRVADGMKAWFLFNQSNTTASIEASFAVTGMQPEWWDPVDGSIRKMRVFRIEDGRTILPVGLEAGQSGFVVFRSPLRASSMKQVVSVSRAGAQIFPATVDSELIQKDLTLAVWAKPQAETPLDVEDHSGVRDFLAKRNYLLYPAPGHEAWKEGTVGIGIAVGKNGVCVLEHGAAHFVSVLTHPTALSDWTHIAVVYHDGVPSLYLNGEMVRTGQKSGLSIHSSVGVAHTRPVPIFVGESMEWVSHDKALDVDALRSLAKVPRNSAMATPPMVDFLRGEFTRAGDYELTHIDGTKRHMSIPQMPEQVLTNPWKVGFDPRWGGPADPIIFATLEDWSKHPEPGIKYYSGTAIYRTTFDVPVTADRIRLTHLSLGKVHNLARVTLNGTDLGVAWCSPWRLAIASGVLKEKGNQLEIAVVNTWVNRLIGDEQEPDDFLTESGNQGQNPPGPWDRLGGYDAHVKSRGLKELPDWIIDRQPRPSKGRYTFSSWFFHDKNAPLQPAGLLGPVRLLALP